MKKFSYCNAGHHSPLFWHVKENSIQWLKPTAPAIGLIPDTEFKSSEIMVNKEDVIVFYTDGLTEVRNQKKEEYGEEGLIKSLQKRNNRTAEDLLDDIWNDVGAHGTNITDDITLMVVRFM